MYEILQKAHSGWAYIVLLAVAVAALNSLSGHLTKRAFKKSDRQLALFGLIAAHLQLVIGLVLYFVSPLGFHGAKIPEYWLTAMEHPAINIIALVLITVGWSLHKRRAEDTRKFSALAWFYAIGLVLILSRIPYDLWFK